MQQAKREASSRPNRVARWAGISVVLAGVVSAAWLTVRTVTPERPTRHKSEREVAAPESAEELQKLKASIQRLERSSSAMKVALAASDREAPAEAEAEAASDTESESTPTAESAAADPQADLEKHREVLRELDVALAKAEGNLVQRHESAAVFREQLNSATQGRVQVVDLQCATDFCKAVLEEDTSLQPAMNTSEIIDATPFLAQEAMFDYETEGSRKRTFVYAALEGRSLPFDRAEYPAP